MNRTDYLKQRALEEQAKIVNFKGCNTRTSEALIWTYRTTTCDVITVITTAFPVTDGKMKDIKIKYQEPKRYACLFLTRFHVVNHLFESIGSKRQLR